MSIDTPSFGDTIKRYVKVSSTATSVAVKVLSEKLLGLDINQDKHAADLRDILGNLKGPMMKVAQILATVPGMVPEAYAKEFTQLQSKAPPMGWFFVKRRMAAELGPDWQAQFAHFDETSSFAASLGQVHKAVTLSGETIACKLQYPDMKGVVEADLTQLKWLLSLYESTMGGVATHNLFEEIKVRLVEEIDYTLEAGNMKMFALALQDEPLVRIASVVPELSTDRLLTMSWMEGQPIHEFKDASLELRNHMAATMFRAWYKPFYHSGMIHGDPHFGNYTFDVKGDALQAVNLFDFGCVRLFEGRFVQGVLDLYRALETNDEALAVHAYETWGFKPISKELIEVLNLWAHYLYGPLLDNRTRLIDDSLSGDGGRLIAGRVHKALRHMGGVKPPREFVFMDRAAVGLGSLFILLRAELNWCELFHHLIQDFDGQKLDDRQQHIKENLHHDTV